MLLQKGVGLCGHFSNLSTPLTFNITIVKKGGCLESSKYDKCSHILQRPSLTAGNFHQQVRTLLLSTVVITLMVTHLT